MSKNTTSPQAGPLRAIDAADLLYDACALVTAISARAVQLANESSNLTALACTELTRLLDMARRQAEEVADDMLSIKTEN